MGCGSGTGRFELQFGSDPSKTPDFTLQTQIQCNQKDEKLPFGLLSLIAIIWYSYLFKYIFLMFKSSNVIQFVQNDSESAYFV